MVCIVLLNKDILYFVLNRSNQHDVINLVGQCDVLWDIKAIIFSVVYIVAESSKPFIAVRQDRKVVLVVSADTCKLTES